MSEAVTAVREIGDWQRLVAYVVAKPIGTPSASQLRKYLQDRLAGAYGSGAVRLPERSAEAEKRQRRSRVIAIARTSQTAPGNRLPAARQPHWRRLLRRSGAMYWGWIPSGFTTLSVI